MGLCGQEEMNSTKGKRKMTAQKLSPSTTLTLEIFVVAFLPVKKQYCGKATGLGRTDGQGSVKQLHLTPTMPLVFS